MKVVGIIAEFNPFHNGHQYLIDTCKRTYGADYVVVVMSGDYVQRGAPALLSKFSRARMALKAGAALVLELPLYYSLGSAEFFAEGAISVLSGLGVVTDLAFGSECTDIDKLRHVADILVDEPHAYKDAMKQALSDGESYPSAQAKGLCAQLRFEGKTAPASCPDSDIKDDESDSLNQYMDVFTSPNSGLAVEYLKAIKRRNLDINPIAIPRSGASYHDTNIVSACMPGADPSEGLIPSPSASATGIRRLVQGSAPSSLTGGILSEVMPQSAFEELTGYRGAFLSENSFSDLLRYKLLLEKSEGYEQYMDVSWDLSNRIAAWLDHYEDFTSFAAACNSKNLTYSRISRCLMHILLNITQENMEAYKADNYTSYVRILGMKKASSALMSQIHENATIPVLDRLKDADKVLFPLQKQLFNETLTAGTIYNALAKNGIISEYSLRQIVI